MHQPPPGLERLADLFLYEEGGLVVVDKPAGIPSTGLSLDDPRCLQFWLMRHFGGMVWAVHQLDADTSGVNVFARAKALVAAMKTRMAAATGVKRYFAVCHGAPDFDEKEIDAPIGFLDAEETRLGVTPSGKSARSLVTVLERSGAFAALSVRIFTGRTHQIRIHLAHAGHPLVGEARYRAPPCVLLRRQALHATAMRFADGLEPAAFVAPLPADLRELLVRLGFSRAAAAAW
ncbi:MAG: RluA family pseudouridine synthase [Planctomycetes bacterium]|nr:RluA family pseudouridine synthase [Planctomycetota bacterium]